MRKLVITVEEVKGKKNHFQLACYQGDSPDATEYEAGVLAAIQAGLQVVIEEVTRISTKRSTILVVGDPTEELIAAVKARFCSNQDGGAK